MNINDKIRILREKNKITQKSMADYLGVTQTYISKIESSERQITIDLLNKIADLFVCDINDLISDEKSIEPIILPYRKQNYSVEDLENISAANKIIKNFNQMIDLMEN